MRISRINDVNIIAKLNEPVQNLHHQLYPDRFKPFDFMSVCEYFHKIINEEKHFFLVCFVEDEPVGYIWFEDVEKQETAFSYSSRYVYIHQISVNLNFRGKGVGKLLLNRALEYADEKSINRVGLDYWAKNAAAKEIYKKLGFELEKEIVYLT